MPNNLSFMHCFYFPLSSPQARKDWLWGSLLLYTLFIGWIFNLGHRLDVVHRIFHHQPPYYRGFRPFTQTFLRGLQACLAITLYLSPAVIMGGLSYICYPHQAVYLLIPLCILLFVLAIFTLPGGMTYNAAYRDITYLYRPDKAFKRSVQAGKPYLKAWLIALSAITLSLSLIGLYPLAFDWPNFIEDWPILIPAVFIFFMASVWAWNVVGYAFSQAIVFRDSQQS